MVKKQIPTLQQQELFKRIDFAALTIIMKTRENLLQVIYNNTSVRRKQVKDISKNNGASDVNEIKKKKFTI